ncbi:fibropellin-1 isoform X2 [Patella vulgata]|uniref:fibropellin-1 isoform X2 n=1 Tax=Patella vulgata TaxID=6465 RepID=UPI00217F543F|nr:fibropellin-1 isoform X2 [Patella vulgata]
MVFSDEDFKNRIANGRLTDSDLENYFGVTFDVATAIIGQFDRNGDGELVRSEFTTGRCMAAFARLKNDRDSNINIDLERIKFLLDLNGDQVGQCRNVRCLNNGSCERGICKCTPGYSGDDCRMNLCEINSCPGDTPCVPIIVPNGYVCSCVERSSINQLTSLPRCDARRIITPIYVYGKSQNFVSGISGVPGKKLVISFIDDFGIGSTDSCFNDYLQIAGKKYCGNKAPADIMLSTGLGTQVRFVTGRINQNVGYTFTYQYIDDIPDNNPCKNGGTRTSSETCTCRTGFLGPTCQNTPLITSPGINKKQETTFNLLGSPGKELVLAFNDYFRTPGRNSIDCSKDYVEIGNNRYCGNRAAPSPITIPTGRGTTVVFKCSGEISYRTKLSHVYTET